MKNLGKKRILLVGNSIIFLRILTCYETKKGIYFSNHRRERIYVHPKGSVALPEWHAGHEYDQDFEYDLRKDRIAA